MTWIIQTPTAEEGAQLTGLTPERWTELFEEAYRRQSYFALDGLGVDTRQLPHPAPNWGLILVNTEGKLDG